MDGQHDYIAALQDTLPASLRAGLDGLSAGARTVADGLLRFALGGACPPGAPDALAREWAARQAAARQALQQLRVATPGKRAREDGEEEDGEGDAGAGAGGAHGAKRLRAAPGGGAAHDEAKDGAKDEEGEAEDEADPPRYTLHALSVAAPVRKRFDVRVHARSVRLVHPGTQAVEHTLPLAALRRVFLLPTRGKTRGHWTVLLLSADVPAAAAAAPAGKNAGKGAARDREKDVQIMFGVDAAPTGAYSTTDHTVTDAAVQHARGTPVEPFLRAFLAHVPVALLHTADAGVFRSALAAGGAGVQAYRAAKEGTLWFFDDGILWDGRPAEFWGCADLVGSANAAGEAGTGTDGVRLVSATGRTCSVFVRRRVGGPRRGDDGKEEAAGDEEEEEDVECVETDFSMVDGREQDGITAWVKRHKHLFGRPAPEAQDEAANGGEGYGVAASGKVDVKGKGKGVARPDEDDEDEDDSDFVDSGESDGGSATSDSGSDEEGGGQDEAGDEDEDADGEESEDEEDAEALDPARHPLLRPGAMPKMSKAAMDAAVGMVMEDFVGGSGKGKGKGEEVESEEDELDD
ncbi:uncharacterized protein PHACADRAFT_198609 [Phanerochaete carnosa HHB-10118-sp]|uniref:Histone chaperone RTT106/FACT complex subunit SPT16-like middle domain-containing protein n=1 Tax=Phanerochaete carnosa (strain HHB-10118-sp) TaxID=650164 RepID=K5WQC7_PHACS|nr:uncharacterized protein PHACADRAFT_198609 [Phanerochaete carnosa HHB-10118-sp]EKM52552.1 hypothetical protein PHACADRAFT_198609 [Phanerochaete carnosa HHB-10118-sp]